MSFLFFLFGCTLTVNVNDDGLPISDDVLDSDTDLVGDTDLEWSIGV